MSLRSQWPPPIYTKRTMKKSARERNKFAVLLKALNQRTIRSETLIRARGAVVKKEREGRYRVASA